MVSDVIIRAAASDDVALIFDFISKKADFDRSIGGFSGQLNVTTEKIRHALFSDKPLAYALLAELHEVPIGFALYGFHFSSFAGQPNLWLDDLYVEPLFRNQGIGSVLMQRLAEIARENDCTHLGWSATVAKISTMSVSLCKHWKPKDYLFGLMNGLNIVQLGRT